MTEQLIKRGEIYWVSLPFLSENEKENKTKKSHELQGNHAVVVISNDEQNKFSPLLTILPLTLLKNDKEPYPFQVVSYLEGKERVILVDQIRTIDRQRLGDKLGELSAETMEKVERSLHITLALRN